MTHDLAIINTFVLYIGFMMAIGVYYYRRTRNMSDYFLGNRKLGAWVTSLSAEASDMSGWMLMGVPGYASTPAGLPSASPSAPGPTGTSSPRACASTRSSPTTP